MILNRHCRGATTVLWEWCWCSAHGDNGRNGGGEDGVSDGNGDDDKRHGVGMLMRAEKSDGNRDCDWGGGQCR